MDQRRRVFYFSDVMLRGYYPSYTDKLWKELGVSYEVSDEDKAILIEGTLDFYSFSCYRSTTVNRDTKLGVIGLSFGQNP